jgi:hypothetical protein
MGNYASEGSQWLKSYSERVDKAKGKSNGNKWLIPVIFTIMMGGFVAIMIANGGLDDPQKQGTIKVMGCIAGFMLLLSILLIAKGKKKVASARTAENLNELLRSPEEVAAFDRQMAAAPRFVVENSSNDSFFATDDYLGRRFSAMGNETFEFIRLRDIASLHYQKYRKDYNFDIRDAGGKVLMNGILADFGRLEGLKAVLTDIHSGIQLIEE